MTDYPFPNIELKSIDGQIALDKAQGIVECFVAGIGNKDSVGDIIVSGAFNETLKRRKPRVVWGHSWNDPIGKVLEIYEVGPNDPRLPEKMKRAGIGGLFAKVQFNLTTQKGREAFNSVAFYGSEQEWSIGYKTINATFDPNRQANVLTEVELYEVSPVLHGANQLTGTISVKSAKKPLKDPDGGLTAAGRKFYKRTEGANLKPGVKGPADTPEKMRRKGSFLTRFFTNPRGPMKDSKGRSTRLALSAAAWGEPVPQDMEDARRLAEKGRRLLERYNKVKGKSLDDFCEHYLGGEEGKCGCMHGMRRWDDDRYEDDDDDDYMQVAPQARVIRQEIKPSEDGDIFEEGLALELSPPAMARLQMEMMTRSRRPMKIMKATENLVWFLTGDEMFMLPYHHEVATDQFMFGKPQRISASAPMAQPKPRRTFPSYPDEPGMDDVLRVVAKNEDEMSDWFDEDEKSLVDSSIETIDHLLKDEIATHGSVGRDVVDRLKAVVGLLDDMAPKSAERSHMMVKCAVEDMYTVKSVLDPIFDYHGAISRATENGIEILGVESDEFIEAVDTAVKALGARIGRGGMRAARFVTERFDPNALDGDEDGLVQDSTPFERPAMPRGGRGMASATGGGERFGQDYGTTMTMLDRMTPEQRRQRSMDALKRWLEDEKYMESRNKLSLMKRGMASARGGYWDDIIARRADTSGMPKPDAEDVVADFRDMARGLLKDDKWKGWKNDIEELSDALLEADGIKEVEARGFPDLEEAVLRANQLAQTIEDNDPKAIGFARSAQGMADALAWHADRSTRKRGMASRGGDLPEKPRTDEPGVKKNQIAGDFTADELAELADGLEMVLDNMAGARPSREEQRPLLELRDAIQNAGLANDMLVMNRSRFNQAKEIIDDYVDRAAEGEAGGAAADLRMAMDQMLESDGRGNIYESPNIAEQGTRLSKPAGGRRGMASRNEAYNKLLQRYSSPPEKPNTAQVVRAVENDYLGKLRGEYEMDAYRAQDVVNAINDLKAIASGKKPKNFESIEDAAVAVSELASDTTSRIRDNKKAASAMRLLTNAFVWHSLAKDLPKLNTQQRAISKIVDANRQAKRIYSPNDLREMADVIESGKESKPSWQRILNELDAYDPDDIRAVADSIDAERNMLANGIRKATPRGGMASRRGMASRYDDESPIQSQLREAAREAEILRWQAREDERAEARNDAAGGPRGSQGGRTKIKPAKTTGDADLDEALGIIATDISDYNPYDGYSATALGDLVADWQGISLEELIDKYGDLDIWKWELEGSEDYTQTRGATMIDPEEGYSTGSIGLFDTDGNTLAEYFVDPEGGYEEGDTNAEKWMGIIRGAVVAQREREGKRGMASRTGNRPASGRTTTLTRRPPQQARRDIERTFGRGAQRFELDSEDRDRMAQLDNIADIEDLEDLIDNDDSIREQVERERAQWAEEFGFDDERGGLFDARPQEDRARRSRRPNRGMASSRAQKEESLSRFVEAFGAPPDRDSNEEDWAFWQGARRAWLFEEEITAAQKGQRQFANSGEEIRANRQREEMLKSFMDRFTGTRMAKQFKAKDQAKFAQAYDRGFGEGSYQAGMRGYGIEPQPIKRPYRAQSGLASRTRPEGLADDFEDRMKINDGVLKRIVEDDSGFEDTLEESSGYVERYDTRIPVAGLTIPGTADSIIYHEPDEYEPIFIDNEQINRFVIADPEIKGVLIEDTSGGKSRRGVIVSTEDKDDLRNYIGVHWFNEDGTVEEEQLSAWGLREAFTENPKLKLYPSTKQSKNYIKENDSLNKEWTDAQQGGATRSNRGLASSAGRGLGESREIYPARANGRDSSAADFVRYDAAKQELIVQYKKGNTYTYGGITAEMADEVENAESLGRALADIKRQAEYTLRPDGTVNGSAPSLAQRLGDNMTRLRRMRGLDKNEEQAFDSAINMANGDFSASPDIERQEVGRIERVADALWADEEYAAAGFLREAMRHSRPGKGLASRVNPRKDRMDFEVDDSIIGGIRNGVKDATRRQSRNSKITTGLRLLDQKVADAKDGKFSITADEYNAIMDSFAALEAIEPDGHGLRGARALLERAADSADGKVSDRGMGRATRNDNNGAPIDMTPRMQAELLNWGQQQRGFRVVQELVDRANRNNGYLTVGDWRRLQTYRDEYGQGGRRTGMRSATGGAAGGRIEGIRGREAAGRTESGRRQGQGRAPGSENVDRSKKWEDVKPANWEFMTLEEQDEELFGNLHPSRSGMSRKKWESLVKENSDAMERRDRQTDVQKRRSARLQRMEESGPLPERAQPKPQTAARESAATAKDAKKLRKQQLTSIGNSLEKASARIDEAVANDDADQMHSDLWGDLLDIAQESDDLTLSKLEAMRDSLDNYLEEAESAEKLTRAEGSSVRNAKALRERIDTLLSQYEDDPFIERGDNAPSISTNRPTGMASRSGMASRDASTPKRKYRKPRELTEEQDRAREDNLREQRDRRYNRDTGSTDPNPPDRAPRDQREAAVERALRKRPKSGVRLRDAIEENELEDLNATGGFAPRRRGLASSGRFDDQVEELRQRVAEESWERRKRLGIDPESDDRTDEWFLKRYTDEVIKETDGMSIADATEFVDDIERDNRIQAQEFRILEFAPNEEWADAANRRDTLSLYDLLMQDDEFDKQYKKERRFSKWFQAISDIDADEIGKDRQKESYAEDRALIMGDYADSITARRMAIEKVREHLAERERKELDELDKRGPKGGMASRRSRPPSSKRSSQNPRREQAQRRLSEQDRRGAEAAMRRAMQYVDQRDTGGGSGQRRGMASAKAGRMEVAGDVDFFKKVYDSLDKEMREADKGGDRATSAALRKLQQIMSRQDVVKISDKMTAARRMLLNQDELDEIIDALMVVVDRQMATGGSRTAMFGQLIDMLANAGIATFINRDVEEINSRKQKRTNAQGRTVEINISD